MICNKCNSKWETANKVDKCPFCGACLLNDAGDTTVDSVLRTLINKNGPEILRNQKLVKAYIMDCVIGQEKEKKMFDFACNFGVVDIFCDFLKTTEREQQKTLVMKGVKSLKEDALMSEENACNTISILLNAVNRTDDFWDILPNIKNKCSSDVCKNIPKYTIISNKCKGCTLCARKCPVGAISGTVKIPHFIDTTKCTSCGVCINSCYFDAIVVV